MSERCAHASPHLRNIAWKNPHRGGKTAPLSTPASAGHDLSVTRKLETLIRGPIRPVLGSIVAVAFLGCTAQVKSGDGMERTPSGTTGGPSTGGPDPGTATTGAGGTESSTVSGTSVGTVVTDGEFPPAPMVLDGKPLYTRFMRLTNQQWER